MGAHFFRHGELPLVVLALLDLRPMHGYDLLSELAERFGPAYQPSPGSIYPAVTALHEEGLIEARDEGVRRVYRLTGSGRRALHARRVQLGEVEARVGANLSRREPVDALLDAFAVEVRDAARAAGVAATRRLLESWKRELSQAARRQIKEDSHA